MNTINFRLKVGIEQRVNGIKTLRSTLGCGLKEAKDIVDACGELWEGKRIRMTAAQFGMLVATNDMNNAPLTILDPKVEQPIGCLDLTGVVVV